MDERINSLEPHVSFAALLNSFSVAFLGAVVLTALGIAGMQLIPQINLACGTVTASGLGIFLVSFRTFMIARDKLQILYDEYQDTCANNRQVALRTIETEQIRLQVNLRGNATANFGTQQNVIVAETPDARTFVLHFREFMQRAQLLREIGDGTTGYERRLYLAPGNPFTFRDGSAISHPEYQNIMETIEATGLVDGRRKGTAGRAKTRDQVTFET